ncbi:hypothetical protein [Cytobacillus massiliigabonensis]|nr:hypothetical protein [Cytobacillus massiliigabonensis]
MKSFLFSGSILVSSFILAGCSTNVFTKEDQTKVLIEKDKAEQLNVL